MPHGPARTAVVAVALLLAASCSSHHAATPAATQPAVAPSPSASTATSSDLGHVLETIALRASDVGAGTRVALMQGGDQVADQVTLDNCGYDFTTEAHRVARRQYTIAASGGAVHLSNELVAYDSAAEAAHALRQLWTSVITCPKTPVQSTVAGTPPLRMTILTHRRGVSLPVRDNALAVEKAVATGQGTLYLGSVFQVEGRYLDAVYLLTQTRPTAAQVATLLRLARITGARLAAA